MKKNMSCVITLIVFLCASTFAYALGFTHLKELDSQLDPVTGRCTSKHTGGIVETFEHDCTFKKKRDHAG